MNNSKQVLLENLEFLFKQNNFRDACLFYQNNNKIISEEEYSSLYSNQIINFKEQLIKKCEIGKQEFLKLAYANTCEELDSYIEFLDEIVNLLEKFSFKEADIFFINNNSFGFKKNDYISIKATYILKYFKSILPNIALDREKTIAIADFSKYQLLDARAGSGKTTTICLRTKLLIEKYGIKPSEILILAFNNCVPEKINKDLNYKYNIKNFSNAMTFHKFAGAITGNRVSKNIIEDNLRYAINKVLSNENLYKKLYEFYKYPLLLDDTFQPSMSDEEFYFSRKTMRYLTLDGQEVDSYGEKYIADYLFERNIPYKCQPRIILSQGEKADFGLKCQIYCPDFWLKINDQTFYWEHWAGTSFEELKNNVLIKDPNRYLRGIEIKKKFMQKRGYKLIETHSRNSKCKENFEKFLDNIFREKLGYIPKKLSKEKLLNKIKKFYKKTKLEQTFESFIKQIDNRLIDIYTLQKRSKNFSKGLANFLEIGLDIYNEYNNTKNTPDFNDLIKNATQKIKHNYNTCIFNENGDKLENVKYIMIDEYQDFSALFYNLIKNIKLKNSQLNIFCVGDNLQSIYSFAGANKNYIENFQKYFSMQSSIRSLTMNYRSKYELVQFTNQLAVNKCRELSRANKINIGGEIYNIKVDETYINNETCFEIINDTKDKILAKYLKTIEFIIKSNINKTILILSRTKYLYDIEIEKLFKDNLEKYNNFEILTMHKSKGLEYDIIILLNANEGVIPMINTMSETQQIFGVSINDILDEELRLLYVALTRAKEKIYILNESYCSSEIIQSLTPKETYIYDNKLTKYNIAYRQASNKAEWKEANKVKFDLSKEIANDIEKTYGSDYSWEY